jgi:hypothetical protein
MDRSPSIFEISDFEVRAMLREKAERAQRSPAEEAKTRENEMKLRADKVVSALDQATCDLSMLLMNFPDAAEYIRSSHEGTVQYAGLRLHNDIHEITERNQS